MLRTNVIEKLQTLRTQAEIEVSWLEHDGEDEERQRRLRKLIDTIRQTEEQALSAELTS